MHRGTKAPADPKTRVKLPDKLVTQLDSRPKPVNEPKPGEVAREPCEEEARARSCGPVAAIAAKSREREEKRLIDPFGLGRHVEIQRRPRPKPE